MWRPNTALSFLDPQEESGGWQGWCLVLPHLLLLAGILPLTTTLVHHPLTSPLHPSVIPSAGIPHAPIPSPSPLSCIVLRPIVAPPASVHPASAQSRNAHSPTHSSPTSAHTRSAERTGDAQSVNEGRQLVSQTQGRHWRGSSATVLGAVRPPDVNLLLNLPDDINFTRKPWSIGSNNRLRFGPSRMMRCNFIPKINFSNLANYISPLYHSRFTLILSCGVNLCRGRRPKPEIRRSALLGLGLTRVGRQAWADKPASDTGQLAAHTAPLSDHLATSSPEFPIQVPSGSGSGTWGLSSRGPERRVQASKLQCKSSRARPVHSRMYGPQNWKLSEMITRPRR